MTLVKTYKRMGRDGTTTIETFEGIQATLHNIPFFEGGIPRQDALELVNEWNRILAMNPQGYYIRMYWVG